MAGYQKLSVLLKEELDELAEEGRLSDKSVWQSRIDACGDDRKQLMAVYGELCALPQDKNFPYSEPTEYDEITAAADGKYSISEMPAEASDNFHGAWLGRCIGCALGQPVELWNHKDIAAWYEGAGRKAVDGYVPTHSGDKVNNGAATDGNIKCMPSDDDIRFTVLALKLIKSKGFDFDTYDVGANWVYNLPYRAICTAENQAYLNFSNVDEFGPWGRPDHAMELFRKNNVSTYLNPYREWIGAQIRIDGYAYAAAGNPRLAAKLAHTDAYLSHTKNGIYGAMFFAAMISAAFAEKDVKKCYKAALSLIPPKSRFAAEMNKAAEIASVCHSSDELVAQLSEKMSVYSYVHAINNSAVCLASILWADGDFEKAVTTAVQCGMDTDCNGATVGSFMGALVGASNIPGKFKNPLNDTFYCGLAPYEPGSISGFAAEFEELHAKLCKSI